MTVPMDYSHATEWFDHFLVEVAEEAGLVTRHQGYTVVEGVMRTFGRGLTAEQAIRFAQVLPPLLRALFIGTREPLDTPLPFLDLPTLTREVQSLRHNHNLAPDSAISDVAAVLRRQVDPALFADCLSELPSGARDFWNTPSA